jgi:hypothetical protein
MEPTFLGPPPRLGDLLQLPSGRYAVALGDLTCRDTSNCDHPLDASFAMHRVFDMALTDVDGVKVDIGESVAIIEGANAGLMGSIMHAVDGHFFLNIADRIVAVPAKTVRSEKPGPRSDDIIGEEVVLIVHRLGMSEPFPIRRMDEDGTLRLTGSDAVLRLAEYGVKWRFAAEVGRSSKNRIEPIARKK